MSAFSRRIVRARATRQRAREQSNTEAPSRIRRLLVDNHEIMVNLVEDVEREHGSRSGFVVLLDATGEGVTVRIDRRSQVLEVLSSLNDVLAVEELETPPEPPAFHVYVGVPEATEVHVVHPKAPGAG